jgi:hypothetical protein
VPLALQRFSGSKKLGRHPTKQLHPFQGAHVYFDRMSVFGEPNVSTTTTDEPARGLTKTSIS